MNKNVRFGKGHELSDLGLAQNGITQKMEDLSAKKFPQIFCPLSFFFSFFLLTHIIRVSIFSLWTADRQDRAERLIQRCRFTSFHFVSLSPTLKWSTARGSGLCECTKKIAKTGSLCCVAARPHGSNTTSRDWSVGPHEPYWRTNSSFSPPPSRWDFQFQTEGLQHGPHNGSQPNGSSASSNSKESRSWVRGNQLYNHHYTSDGAGMFLSSSSDLSQGPQWTPPAIQEIRVDDLESAPRRGVALGPPSFKPTMEGTSENPDSGGSTSFRSDSSESEPKSRTSSHRTFSSRCSFMSKPIHPLSFPRQASPGEVSDFAVTGLPEFDAATQRDAHSWSSASSSLDFADVSETFESETCNRSCYPSNSLRCGLCERLLSQRSPWSSRRIVRSGDMPVTGVLSCCHVFHAECLEQTTPKMRRNDPPCPLCARSEEENCPEQRSCSRSRNSFPRLKPFNEDGLSRPWGCVQVGDCVEGALHAPPRNSMLLLNRNRIKKNLSLKGNSSREFPGKLKKSGSYSSQQFNVRSIEQGSVGCSKSKIITEPSMKG